MVNRVAGAAVLTLSEVVQRLRLSDEQQAQIRRIVNGASESIRRLQYSRAAWKGMVGHEASQRREKLLGESRRRASTFHAAAAPVGRSSRRGSAPGDLPQPGER